MGTRISDCDRFMKKAIDRLSHLMQHLHTLAKAGDVEASS